MLPSLAISSPLPQGSPRHSYWRLEGRWQLAIRDVQRHKGRSEDHLVGLLVPQWNQLWRRLAEGRWLSVQWKLYKWGRVTWISWKCLVFCFSLQYYQCDPQSFNGKLLLSSILTTFSPHFTCMMYIMPYRECDSVFPGCGRGSLHLGGVCRLHEPSLKDVAPCQCTGRASLEWQVSHRHRWCWNTAE